uniref:Uncharacterized protein n=2 Tax=Oryza sativa subsp. japonica TaxID=39947 RepID=Q7Y0A6_ORYSJ|nr:hypothetical protein [Oryza sativa Japonica Group]ABF97971.1 hypothetical protein LOC_Os03g45350 [Oryza sativa Japonica Group]
MARRGSRRRWGFGEASQHLATVSLASTAAMAQSEILLGSMLQDDIAFDADLGVVGEVGDDYKEEEDDEEEEMGGGWQPDGPAHRSRRHSRSSFCHRRHFSSYRPPPL